MCRAWARSRSPWASPNKTGETTTMKLYSFFRSGTSHRLRIALNLKGLRPDYFPVDLRVDEQAQAPFKQVNPQGLVPALTLDDGRTLIQSPAPGDRKSTRLNSSHSQISYAVFCLKKKKKAQHENNANVR